MGVYLRGHHKHVGRDAVASHARLALLDGLVEAEAVQRRARVKYAEECSRRAEELTPPSARARRT